jgi:TPR repeat protein
MERPGNLVARGLGALQKAEKPSPGAPFDVIAEYRKAAERGDAEAQLKLGWEYHIGKFVPRGDEEAMWWWKKAADQGCAAAQTSLGMAYTDFDNVPTNYVEAYKWFTLGRDCASNAGTYVTCTMPLNDQRDLIETLMDKRNEIPEAKFRIGDAYLTGDGVPQDENKAIYWWTLVYDGNFCNSTWRLASVYAYGNVEYGRYHRLGEKNLVRGYMWFFLSDVAREEYRKKTKYYISDAKLPMYLLREKKLVTPDEINEAKILAREWLEDAPEWLQDYTPYAP